MSIFTPEEYEVAILLTALPFLIKHREVQKMSWKRMLWTCHHCKTKRNNMKALCGFCVGKAKKKSSGVYCEICIKNHYKGTAPSFSRRYWKCPRCLGICKCAACIRMMDNCHKETVVVQKI